MAGVPCGVLTALAGGTQPRGGLGHHVLLWSHGAHRPQGATCPAPPAPPGRPGISDRERRSEWATGSQGRASGPLVPPCLTCPSSSWKDPLSFSSQEHPVQLWGLQRGSLVDLGRGEGENQREGA